MKFILASILILISGGNVLAAESTMGADRVPLFGETHIHTAYSLDAYMFSTRANPDEAYEFAKGKPLKHPLGKTYQLKRPLDFMAVTDHGFFMGSIAKMSDPNHRLSQHPLAKIVNSPDQSVRDTGFPILRSGQFDGKPLNIGTLADPEVQRETWDETIAAANRHNDPGTFTAFIAYEYSSIPQRNNQHRNVIFKGSSAPLPFSRSDSENPEDLWVWMDKIRADGYEALAIPHNSNQSNGTKFERVMRNGSPMTQEYAARRIRNEPLVEVTQVKGTSETHPMLSPNDEFADFELWDNASRPDKAADPGNFVRSAYRTGLELQDNSGLNPYRFGLIGSTDSHTGIVPVIESEYSGKLGALDGTPAKRLQGQKTWSASGLAAVWAQENTRDSIYEAFRRKETWATTGPRIKVRFFGGFDMKEVSLGEEGGVDAAYASGVSMGGELKASDVNGANGAPTFAVWAIKDPESGHLDRIQIVKGWSVGGKSQEKVYDVVWSGDRKVDAATGQLPAVGNTVNLETLEYTNSIGAVELIGTWTDPDFGPKHNAFYYVRVLEIPTPRWSAFDAKALGVSHPEGLPKTIQERAFTSPIWYDSI